MSDAICQAVEIADNVFWVGAVDWDVRVFRGHHYHTPRGTTYNAYLVRGAKSALIDTVHAPFTADLIERVQQVMPLPQLDYIVVNHVEMDHSGALPAILKLAP